MLCASTDEFREQREFLVAHGFKRAASDPAVEFYELKHVVLGDVTPIWGFR